MPRRHKSWVTAPTPSAALLGLALAIAGLLLWASNRANPGLVLAAAPVSPDPAGGAPLPLLSSVVVPGPASGRRAPIQLSNVGTHHAQAAPAAPTEPAERKSLCIRALAQLRDDHIRGNATQGLRTLDALEGAYDPNLRPLLLATLKSRDLQQRSLIAGYLRARTQTAEEEMLLAAAQDLSDDIVPKPNKSLAFPGWSSDPPLGLPPRLHNASEAARLLIDAGERAWPYLLKRLNASDPQERFLSAVVLARTGCEQDLRFTVTILVTHLKHNDWKGDATIAGRALHALGSKALPQLRRLQGIADGQASRLVKLAILEIEHPSRNAREAYDRAQRIAPSRGRHPLAVWRFAPDTLDGLTWR